ncbi:NAD(P)H dehydrogenase (quinone) [Solirubrobacter pauli]|uniref:NAD(P)H dehydrogenase (Quinone) n=1 Tax=Solirubrobacter pauli TaxID=166793 RepID=A0A660KYS8_9ACTN|nr:NAD(P)H-binding protein [Solirubrobacter pauli]RKQ86871.1 NAD(P)H dehydrogenase (quinone) [Solirubrobacter pauli]
METSKIIITGAAGHLGRLVTEQLLDVVPPEALILVTRRPEALHAASEQGVEVRYGDFDDRRSLRSAFAGGTRMLLISTDAIGRRAGQHRAAINAATAAGVEHVVFTSNVNPVAANPLGPHAWEQGMTEGMLMRSGMRWTILRFTNFAELVLPPAATAIHNGQMVSNNGAGRIVPISRVDCAEAAAVVLTGDDHDGQTYDITGSQRLSARDLVELYDGFAGRPIKLVPVSDALLTSILLGIGTPAPIAFHMTAFGRAVRHGFFDVVDPTFERLTGHAPATLRTVLSGHRADLLAVG